MARIVFAMNLSLDGYVDHDAFAPGPQLFRRWIEHVRALSGSLYGRGMYEIMAYWDEDHPQWSPAERAFAAAWRAMPKWVASRTLKSVGPNAELVQGDVVSAARALKDRLTGEIAVSGPNLAQALTEAKLIDAYQLYVHPTVLGRGRPLFAGALKRLRFVDFEQVGEDVVRLTYAPD